MEEFIKMEKQEDTILEDSIKENITSIKKHEIKIRLLKSELDKLNNKEGITL